MLLILHLIYLQYSSYERLGNALKKSHWYVLIEPRGGSSGSVARPLNICSYDFIIY